MMPVPNNVPGNPFSQQQPAIIQTPFGPMPNPRANQALQQRNGNVPPGVTGQQNPFGATSPFGANGAPGAFGATNPGTENNLFGNTSPQMFNQNPAPAAPQQVPPNRE